MIDTHSIIRESLDLLKPRLHAYLLTELRATFGDRLPLREPRIQATAHPDVQALLSILLDHWQNVFARKLRPADRALAHELKGARNLWAHEQPVSFDQAYRAVDSVQLLLTSLDARDALSVLDVKKAEMRRLQVQLEVEYRARDDRAEASQLNGSGPEGGEYWTQLTRQIDTVYATHTELEDRRRQHPWLIGALGDPSSRVWFVGENPSLGRVERARDPSGGSPTPEAQWWASRGDRLFRDMLVKHGFKTPPPEAPGGWNCYITNAIKEADYVARWRGSPAERRAKAAEIWAPVLRWELEQSKPILVVALGKTVRRILVALEDLGLRFPRIEMIQHYSYVGQRPQGSLGPMHPDRVRAYGGEFQRIVAILQCPDEEIHGTSGELSEWRAASTRAGSGLRRPPHPWREDDDLVAFYLQRYGADRLPYTPSQIAQVIGIEEGTLRMRISNFKALTGEGGLQNWAKQSERVFEAHRNLDEASLRRRVMDHIASLAT